MSDLPGDSIVVTRIREALDLARAAEASCASVLKSLNMDVILSRSDLISAQNTVKLLESLLESEAVETPGDDGLPGGVASDE